MKPSLENETKATIIAREEIRKWIEGPGSRL